MRDSYLSDVRSFIRENSGIFDSERLFSIIDKLENDSFFTGADSITEEGIFSLYGSVTSVPGTREIEREDRSIRYMKFTIGKDLHFTLWNEEIDHYGKLIKTGTNIRCAFCRVSINGYGREASLGTFGFIVP